MDASLSTHSSRKLVVSSAASARERPVSISDRMVRVRKPVALQPEESAFIEKTLHYISSIHGAVANKLILSFIKYKHLNNAYSLTMMDLFKINEIVFLRSISSGHMRSHIKKQPQNKRSRPSHDYSNALQCDYEPLR